MDVYTCWCHWSFHQKWKNFIMNSLKNPVNLWVKVWLAKMIKITEEMNNFYKENIQWLNSFQSAGVKLMITLGIISKINKFYKKNIQRLSSLQSACVELVITLAITSKMNRFYDDYIPQLNSLYNECLQLVIALIHDRNESFSRPVHLLVEFTSE